MSDPMKLRVDRTVMVVETLDTMTSDTAYWAERTLEERLAALELMRRIKYGPAATRRMKKVLEIVTRDDVKDEEEDGGLR
jgi:hypothetical protein